MTTDDEMLAAEILMIICFVPIALWLLLTGLEYVAHRWVRPYVRRTFIYRDWRANFRVMR